jgi:hypothetical protein
VDQEDEPRDHCHEVPDAELPQPADEQHRDERMQDHVDDVVTECPFPKELALDRREKQVHRRVVRGVELGGAPGVEDLAQGFPIERLRVGVRDDVPVIVRDEGGREHGLVETRSNDCEPDEERQAEQRAAFGHCAGTGRRHAVRPL